ncbi:dienelactone hydrolase family protein [Saccharopolyspora sp. NFXS83]|uniref:poly(ethylene terephthalate) hydrolase family protein n=1 Tax=Saccharopolyspora sp. NFXS83 TaxID=2993560 RepID=UPI00224B3C6D|nr:alpha/beta hydrolase [Saccharopolyspora sp. NFXS83]MCX2729544.1 dienelactone hydrolase family protein [Saccharopolyspora sp. NFXS83]
MTATSPSPTGRSRNRRTLVAATALLGLLAGGSPIAHAAEDSYQRGPDPTDESIEAPLGSFAVEEEVVSRTSVSDFGGGTIYYPTDTSEGTFGAVAISPGYTGTQSSMSWYGPRLASQGFVVFTIDTLSRYDQPDARARQLLAALDHLTTESGAADRIDPNRLGVMGHSMGGGGSLQAALDNPDLRAAIPLTPWNTVKDWSAVQTPTLIIGAEDDTVASVRTHAEPFYESLPEDPDKAYLELAGAGHLAPNTDNTTIAKSSIAWLKRFVDEDTRYDRFLCPPPSGPEIQEYRDTCPIG